MNEEASKYVALSEKIAKIQSELFVPKGQNNTFGGYKYRSCEDILMAVKPLCEKYGCLLMLGDAIPVEVGTRIYIKADVTIYDIKGCVSKTITAYAREEETKKGMDGSQITGASISYARKYALASLFCIDNEKDSDATSTKRKDGAEVITDKDGKPEICEGTGEPKTTINEDQINAIYKELGRTGISIDKILERVKKDSLEQMTHADYVSIMASLNKTKDKKGEETK